MTKKASGEAASKTDAKNLAKKAITLKEAFSIIRDCDAEIKEIYSTRTENEIDVSKILDRVTAERFVASIGVTAISGAIALTTDFVLADILGIGGILATAHFLVTCGIMGKLHLGAPLKHRKLVAERKIHDQLIEFHEETMAEQAQVVLKKAKRALKVINAELKEDGQSIYFNTTKGEEGFVLKQPESFDQFEMAYLRLSRKQTQQKLELVTSEVKALESKTVA